MEILARELNRSPVDIVQDGQYSKILEREQMRHCQAVIGGGCGGSASEAWQEALPDVV